MSLIEHLRREFNEWARAGRGAKMEVGHRPTGEQAIRRMAVGPKAHVIDVGCGAGWATRLLADYATEGHVVGVDVSDAMIQEAREVSANYNNVDFRVAASHDLPFAPGAFSHAFSMEALYYCPDVLATLQEIRRVLQERGGLCVVVLDLYRENEPSHRWVEQLQVPVHLLSIAEYRELYAKAGFTDIQDARLHDPSPLLEVYQGTSFASHEEYLKFREAGSLMLSGRVMS